MGSRSPRTLVLLIALAALLALGVEPCQPGSPGEAPAAERPGRSFWVNGVLGWLRDLSRRVEKVEECTCCCEGELAPVCSADGTTWVNFCEARCAGAEVVGRGPCPSDLCGGPEGIPCEDREFCEVAPGCRDPFAVGRCEERPELCTEEYAPVCGCDGETYGNDCLRRQAGVPLAHRGGACGPPPCDTDEDCAEGSFCEVEGCGALDVSPAGACVPKPEICPRIFAPVCGCDGRTYGNDCERRRAGVSKKHEGPCQQVPEVCGGIAGLQCSDREDHCFFEPGTCRVVDNQGVCRKVPEACVQVYNPVCGCDRVTYANECEAIRARAQIDHVGPCSDDPTCGGFAGIPCPPGEVCAYPPGGCRIADRAGTCVDRPEACLQIYDPVCGCDGRTYGNDCEALRAGMPIDFEGECSDRP